MFRVLFKNDQLLYTAISMALFMIGYVTTTSFGVYYFKYAFGNEDMYSVFAAILGVSQIAALSVFPLFSKKYSRKSLYAFSTVLVVVGYLIFFFAPMKMLYIGAAGILLFVGEAFIQLLMLMFLTDTVEYGQWKLGSRNESITFSIQPFINKIGGAIANGIVGVTLILSGINAAETPADVTESGLLMMKFAMLILPLIFIVIGYIIYKKKFKIDKEMFDKIIADLAERGDIKQN
jgi:melibiose permease/lactose/raffinose/galactose permease